MMIAFWLCLNFKNGCFINHNTTINCKHKNVFLSNSLMTECKKVGYYHIITMIFFL